MRGKFNTLSVRSVTRETPDAVSIVLAVPEALAGAYRFEPGQHLTLRTTLQDEEVRRAYSICTGLDDGELAIAVKHHDGGLFSTFANTVLKAGDAIDVMGPQGRFTIPPVPRTGSGTGAGSARRYLAIAAGSGITPVLSIIRTVLAREPGSQVVLLYGNRDARSIIFKTALEDLKDAHIGRFTLLNVLSREHQDVGLLNGRIDAEKIRAAVATFAGARPDYALLCGPIALLKEARQVLEELGLPRDRMRTEIFAAQGGGPGGTTQAARPAMKSAVARAAPAATARVLLNGRSTTVELEAGETVLDAVTRAGLEAPFSCRGGMCCTCRARLTEGEVAMAVNYSLEPWEIESGFVLTCQARPKTATIAIDYDAR